jgi:hypothetical protein
MTSTTEDVIKAAASVARDAAEGRLDPAALEAEVLTACRELFADVRGPEDLLFELQVAVARGVLAAHGISADELREYAAVQARFEDAEGK